MIPTVRRLADAALLVIWEQGQAHAPMVRTDLLLAAARPASDEAARAALAVSAADLALLRLHRSTFGSRLPAETTCPACASSLEFDLDAGTLIDGLVASTPDAERQRHDIREPTIGDLHAIATVADLGAGVRRLAALCHLDPLASPSDADLAEIDAVYGRSAIRLRLDCADCGHAWHEDFDIAAYLWLEVERRAHALIDEIHILAAAYGWSETQILALTEARRAAYLQRCGA